MSSGLRVLRTLLGRSIGADDGAAGEAGRTPSMGGAGMMTRIRRSGIWILGAALLWTAACSKPAKVEVKPARVEMLALDSTQTLDVAVLDQKGRPIKKAKLSYKSSDPAVADVDASGKVAAIGSGEATVTASVGDVSGTATVVVRGVKSITLALPEGGAVGCAGTNVPLTVKALNERGEALDLAGIKFTSSAPEVAAVDGKGVLTLKASGAAVIKAALGKQAAEILANVEVETPAAVKVDTPSQWVAAGQSAPLAFTVLSNKGRPMKFAATFTSSSENVATVDAAGVVTGVGRGTATVTISAGSATNQIRLTVR